MQHGDLLRLHRGWACRGLGLPGSVGVGGGVAGTGWRRQSRNNGALSARAGGAECRGWIRVQMAVADAIATDLTVAI